MHSAPSGSASDSICGGTVTISQVALLKRLIANVIEEIRLEIPMRQVTQMVAIGGDVRLAASQILDQEHGGGVREIPREAFLAFCAEMARLDEDALVERHRLPQVSAETLVPALLVYRDLVLKTAATRLIVPDVSLRAGLLVAMAGGGSELMLADFSAQVLASAQALGDKYRYDAPHAQTVAHLGARLFDDLAAEHALGRHDRLLLQVAALLHDIGVFVGVRAHHKHTHYILDASEIFGLSKDDMKVVANVARYHRRGLPQATHQPFMTLGREDRVRVQKLGGLLRLANALDAEHLQKVRDLRVDIGGESWVLQVEGTGDLTMERLVAASRADMLTEVFGRRLVVQGAGVD